MIVFRHADFRFPFLWEDETQPSGRWHAEGEGPVHYFADTPDGAWAELLRHEGIQDPVDLSGLRRTIWAVEIGDPPDASPVLSRKRLLGDLHSYERCQLEARRLRRSGIPGVRAPSAALLPGGARGFRVDGGLQYGPSRDGTVYVLFGRRPDLVGWVVAREGRPHEDLLERVRHFQHAP